MEPGTREYLTVSELTEQIKRALESGFPSVRVGGEISNYYLSPAGHSYFTLKDDGAQIRIVLFRGKERSVSGKVEDGKFAVVSGQLAVYEKRGEYQIVATAVDVSGIGELLIMFQKLKERLQREGLFDEERKKKPPVFPSRVGIVTSLRGAAVRDMVRIIRNRFANTEIVISPAMVQGDGAAREISEALQTIDREGKVDVIIVGRGGGSIEDLWAFNEELVVRTIASLDTPVISAVGHETDFTLTDFVADVRASTPSNAAEIAVPVRFEQQERIHHLMARIQRKVSEEISILRSKLNYLRGEIRDPRITLRSKRLHLADLEEKLSAKSPGRYLDSLRIKTGGCFIDMERKVKEKITGMRARLENIKGKIVTLDPRGILERGYSITFDSNTGSIIADSREVEKGTRIETLLFRGRIFSRVEGKE
ncbi:MAG: exodeoxyribonuclease VII large subunit [Deltaproteobacteria bacterium]|nr:exodeoxyribonuclease VII large subunit [Deltaproteobacteria bacterium]NIS76666.1 exodeoxyribonuclease VII large subunit [Deltaproteobacteria bacterium]